MKKESEKRMYVLVPYNLSPIQQGIQAAHAGIEHTKYMTDLKNKKFLDWIENWKTMIVLNGGTTGKHSSMHKYRQDLLNLGVDHTLFHEPDLNDALTAIAFVLDLEKDSHIVGYLKQLELA